jgi:ribose/xylose/arabinose/galactoside ABC-type transport system permease subunit
MNKTIYALFGRFQYEKYAAFIALAVLFAASSVLSPYFLQAKNLLNILRQVSYTGTIALGMTFVIISGFPWGPSRPSTPPWGSCSSIT